MTTTTAPATLTCNCSGRPVSYTNTAEGRARHNRSVPHVTALYKEIGVPQWFSDNGIARAQIETAQDLVDAL